MSEMEWWDLLPDSVLSWSVEYQSDNPREPILRHVSSSILDLTGLQCFSSIPMISFIRGEQGSVYAYYFNYNRDMAWKSVRNGDKGTISSPLLMVDMRLKDGRYSTFSETQKFTWIEERKTLVCVGVLLNMQDTEGDLSESISFQDLTSFNFVSEEELVEKFIEKGKSIFGCSEAIFLRPKLGSSENPIVYRVLHHSVDDNNRGAEHFFQVSQDDELLVRRVYDGLDVSSNNNNLIISPVESQQMHHPFPFSILKYTSFSTEYSGVYICRGDPRQYVIINLRSKSLDFFHANCDVEHPDIVIFVTDSSTSGVCAYPKSVCSLAKTYSMNFQYALQQLRFDLYSSMFHVSLDMLSIAGFDTYFRILNPAWSLTLGYSHEELLGQSFLSFIHPDDIESTIDAAKQLEKGGVIVDFVNRYRTKSGEYRHLCWRATADIRRKLIFSTARDITLEKQQQEQIIIAKEQADIANQAKTAFLANMSHEIRTPLNGILGMTMLLQDSNLSEEQKEGVSSIHSSGLHLLNIINDILDLSKIESEKLELEVLPINLLVLCEDAIKLAFPCCKDKDLFITSIVHHSVSSIEFLGDETRLRQILVNLIGNALKFTSNGSVTIRVRPLLRDEAGFPTVNGDLDEDPYNSFDWSLSESLLNEEYLSDSKESLDLLFCVIDTGIGIHLENLHKVFDSFNQVDTSINRKYGGSGLGTSISYKLVTMMKGRIWLYSKPNVGTRFYFRIPFHLSIPNPSPTRQLSMMISEKTAENLIFIGANRDCFEAISHTAVFLMMRAHHAKSVSEAQEIMTCLMKQSLSVAAVVSCFDDALLDEVRVMKTFVLNVQNQTRYHVQTASSIPQHINRPTLNSQKISVIFLMLMTFEQQITPKVSLLSDHSCIVENHSMLDSMINQNNKRRKLPDGYIPSTSFVNRGDYSDILKHLDELIRLGGIILRQPLRNTQLFKLIRKHLVSTRNFPEDLFPNITADDSNRPMTPEPSDSFRSSVDASFAAKFPMKILVAEDNPTNQKLISKILRKLGYEPEIVCNGVEVLSATDENHFDLILMDVMMPVMDGITATNKLLLKYDGKKMPFIIALTASAMKSEQQKCLAAGMHRFLSKPIEFSLLVKFLEQGYRYVTSS